MAHAIETSSAALAPPARRVSNLSQALRAIAPPDAAHTEYKGVSVRTVRNEAERREVHRITHDAYVERGYCAPQPGGVLDHYPAFERGNATTVLVARAHGIVVGTVSLTLDGALGLQVEKDFPKETAAVRAECARVGCVWRLATRQSVRSERRVVLALIEAVVREAFLAKGLDAFLIAVNPRHESSYRRMLNMTPLARVSGTEGLSDAPAILLRCDSQRCPERWLREAAVRTE